MYHLSGDKWFICFIWRLTSQIIAKKSSSPQQVRFLCPFNKLVKSLLRRASPHNRNCFQAGDDPLTEQSWSSATLDYCERHVIGNCSSLTQEDCVYWFWALFVIKSPDTCKSKDWIFTVVHDITRCGCACLLKITLAKLRNHLPQHHRSRKERRL